MGGDYDLFGTDGFDDFPEEEPEREEETEGRHLFSFGRRKNRDKEKEVRDNNGSTGSKQKTNAIGNTSGIGAIGMGAGSGKNDEDSVSDAGGDNANRRKLMMAAMLTVLGMAGGILTIVTMQSVQTRRQLEAQKSKDERMQQQLEEIEGYLSGLNQSVSDGQVTDSESYEELSSTVENLKGNLEDYRDSNSVDNAAIGQNLDSVILELSSIQDNLEANREAQEDLNGDLSSDVTSSVNQSVGESSRNLSASIESQVSDVREDIRKLIREASADDKEQYQELLTILNGTDSGLSELEESVKTLASLTSDNEAAIKNVSSSLGDVSGKIGDVNGNVSGIRSTVSGIQGDVTALQNGIGTLETSLGKLESQGTEDSAALENVRSALKEITEKSNDLQEQTNAMSSFLAANSGKVSDDSIDSIAGKVAEEIQPDIEKLSKDLSDEMQTDIADLSGELSEAIQSVNDLVEALPEKLQPDSENLNTVLKETDEVRSLQDKIKDISDILSRMQKTIDSVVQTGDGSGTMELKMPEDVTDQLDRIEEAIEDTAADISADSGQKQKDYGRQLEQLSSQVDTLNNTLTGQVENQTEQISDLKRQVDQLTRLLSGPASSTENNVTVPEKSGDQETSEDHAADDLSGSDSGSENPEGSGNSVGES